MRQDVLACSTAYDFFHHVNMVYGTVADFCTPRECPIMSAGDGYVGGARRSPASEPSMVWRAEQSV